MTQGFSIYRGVFRGSPGALSSGGCGRAMPEEPAAGWSLLTICCPASSPQIANAAAMAPMATKAARQLHERICTSQIVRLGDGHQPALSLLVPILPD
jgi:hypothetical protein